MNRYFLLFLCLCIFMDVLQAASYYNIQEDTYQWSQTEPTQVDVRTSVGSRLLRGIKRISPMAENEAYLFTGTYFFEKLEGITRRILTPNISVQLAVDGIMAESWNNLISQYYSAQYDSTKMTDGWHSFTLIEEEKNVSTNLLVLNNNAIIIHGGVLTEDETWEAEKIHIVRHWVRIPKGTTLTIATNAIVKFCDYTGLQVDGTLVADKAVLTSITDDTVGGDTDMDGKADYLSYGVYEITGKGTKMLTECDIRSTSELLANTVWSEGQVIHVINALNVPTGVTLTVEAGAIVKFATGAKLQSNGGIINANDALFTHLADDSDEAGGDTNGDGDTTSPVHDAYTLPNGFEPGEDGKDSNGNDIRYITPQPYKGGTITSGETKILYGNRVHRVTGNIIIDSGGKLIIQPGAIVKMDAGMTITIQSNGILEALGNRVQPIIFTSIQDDEHGGDTNGDEDETMAQPGDWQGIVVSGGTVNMKYTQILYGGDYGSSTKDVIYMNSGSITLDGCIVAHSKQYVAGLDGGTWTMRNSVFYDFDTAFRHFGSNSNVNCVFYDFGNLTNNGSMNFTNCIISNYSKALLWTNWGDENSDSSKYKNCVIWNPPNLGPQSSIKAGSNGNKWADPLFTDANNGDFTLKVGSPCIDAGDGTTAPKTDYWGKPRMDVISVVNSGKPNSDGVCPDIGIYEMADAYTGTCANLQVSLVDCPSEAISGENITIEWTIINKGNLVAIGPWRDTIVLQGVDEALGAQLITIGDAVIDITLAPLDHTTIRRTFKLPPMKSGNWRLGVTTNSYRDIYEVKWADNLLFADEPMAVSLPVWSSTNNQFTVVGYGETGFSLPASASERILEVMPQTGAKMSAYGANGYLPSEGNSDMRSVMLSDGRILLYVPAESGDAYVTLVNEGGVAVSATVAMRDVSLELLEAIPMTILNRGNSSIRIIGTGLSLDSVFTLTMGLTTVTGTTIALENGLTATVHFPVNGISSGSYTLSVTDGGNTASLVEKSR